jgi:glycine/D-amino acid oxidase-like deaminating enzyme
MDYDVIVVGAGPGGSTAAYELARRGAKVGLFEQKSLPAFSALTMVAIWKVLLPGFQGIGWGTYLLGLGEIVLYAVYTAVIFVPSYNWLARRFAGEPLTGGGSHV